MSNVPLIVTTEWLAERLDDPNLRLLDATTFLKQPENGGYYDVWSGKNAYEKAIFLVLFTLIYLKSFPILIQHSNSQFHQENCLWKKLAS